MQYFFTFCFQRLKPEVAESLMSSIFLLVSVDRRISSNLQKAYRTYNNVSPSVRTGEDLSQWFHLFSCFQIARMRTRTFDM